MQWLRRCVVPVEAFTDVIVPLATHAFSPDTLTVRAKGKTKLTEFVSRATSALHLWGQFETNWQIQVLRRTQKRRQIGLAYA